MPLADHRYSVVRRRAGEFALPDARKHYPPDLELEPVHLLIDLHLDLEEELCQGAVTTTVRARRDGPTDLTLHAVGMEGVSVEDPDGHPIEWSYDGSEIRIEWAAAFERAEERLVRVSYRVERPATGLYFSRPSASYPEAPWWAATDNETERARHWLPCIDLPNVRPEVEFKLRALERFTALANGELLDEVLNGDGTKTSHWKLAYPCPSYLTCFAVGDFVRADDGEFDGKPIAYFGTAPHSADDLIRSFGRTGEMLRWMTDRLGIDFPFPKYYQFALPGFGGAMENISLVSWDDMFVLDETLATEWTRLVDDINLHEMAHSFFGDAVVCRDYAHAWLKESWATYMEQVWFEETAGADERDYQYYRDAKDYMREADERYTRPIVTRKFSSSWDLYDSHLYPGGACRLHTLRCELGDDSFWAAVRDYLRTYSGQVVETDDFRRLLESHSGRSLGRFFDQWFHSKGYPQLKVGFKYDSKKNQGAFEIEQTQVDDKEGVPVFELRTDVGWVIDGESFASPVKLDKAKQTVVVPMSEEPQQVRFDPHCKVLHKLELKPGREKLRAQLRAAPDVIGRIIAGCELAKSGRPQDIEEIQAAYQAEGFWGVRVEHADSLAECGSDAAIGALAELLLWEQDPKVIAPLIRSAGRLRDPRIADAVTKRLAAGLPYWATAFAYQALGAQRGEAPYDLLAEAARTEGYHGITQGGAFRGLAATRRDEALDLLAGAVGYGTTPNSSRPAAVWALADIGRVRDKRPREAVVDALVDLLRDPVRRVRESAVLGLEKMAAREAIAALRAYRGPLSQQEQVRVDRAMATLRKGDEPKLGSLEKRLEELQADLRKMGKRLEKMEAASEARADEDGEGPGD